MSKNNSKLFKASILLTTLFSSQLFAESTATYELTFKPNWTAQNHPTSFPSNSAHFSELIGANHNNTVTLWKNGELASSGVENVAETGSVGTLTNEIAGLVNQGLAEQQILGPDASNVGDEVVNFTASEEFPLFSMITMIAPSPDWFIGVNSLNLRDSGGWRDTITVDLLPYDAGTEDGNSFSLSNPASNPHVPIFRITNETPLTEDVPLGQFVFVLKSTTGTVEDDIFKNSFESN